jgi:tRNA (guanine6-N2)-methyltransferase
VLLASIVPPGIEEVAAREVSEVLGLPVFGVSVGKVFFRASTRDIYRANYLLRTSTRVLVVLANTSFGTLRDIRDVASSLDYREFLAPGRSFAVRAERVGEHDFTSVDVAREVGTAVIESYSSLTGVRPTVDLENPDVVLRVIVRGSSLLVGVETSGRSLHRRGYRVYNHPAAINPVIAAAMVYSAGATRTLLDPMCGGATIPIEFVHIRRHYPIALFRRDFAFRRFGIYEPDVDRDVLEELVAGVDMDSPVEAYCIDISWKAIEGARANLASSYTSDAVRLIEGDSTKVSTHPRVNVDAVVSNPPYGYRSHNIRKIEGFYREVLTSLRNSYPGVRAVMVTLSHRQFSKAAEEVGVKVVGSTPVKHGGLLARIFQTIL